MTTTTKIRGIEAFIEIVKSKSREELLKFREQYAVRLQLIDRKLDEWDDKPKH